MQFKTIKMLQWNAQGLVNLATIKQLELLLNSESVDIVFLVETFLKPSNSFFIDGYKIYRNDRLTSEKGGVAIAIKGSIKHTLLPPINTSSFENISISTCLNGKDVRFVCAYCPKYTAGFKRDVKSLCSSSCDFFVFGDFNARNTAWNCVKNNQGGKILFELQLSSNFFIHHPNVPTYFPDQTGRSPSCLDLLLTNSALQISELVT